MQILKELYYGNIAEISRIKKYKDTTTQEKELKLYNELIEILKESNKKLLDDFIDILSSNYDKELEDKYLQGIKTGILIGIEANNIDL